MAAAGEVVALAEAEVEQLAVGPEGVEAVVELQPAVREAQLEVEEALMREGRGGRGCGSAVVVAATLPAVAEAAATEPRRGCRAPGGAPAATGGLGGGFPNSGRCRTRALGVQGLVPADRRRSGVAGRGGAGGLEEQVAQRANKAIPHRFNCAGRVRRRMVWRGVPMA